MQPPWIAVGALLCAAAIAAGAFGAHALTQRLDARSLQLWETAARYLMYGGLGLMALGLAVERWPRLAGAPAWALAIGALVFAGTVFALALGAPRWLGAITPIGGVLLILGFLLLALRTLRP